MAAAEVPDFDVVVDGEAVDRIIVGIDDQLPGAIQKAMAILREVTKLQGFTLGLVLGR